MMRYFTLALVLGAFLISGCVQQEPTGPGGVSGGAGVPPPPTPNCYIKGTIQEVEFIEAHDHPCLQNPPCPTDVELHSPDRYYLTISIQEVSHRSGDTSYYTCEDMYPLNSEKKIFLDKENVNEGDSFEKNQEIEGEVEGLFGYLKYYTLPREGQMIARQSGGMAMLIQECADINYIANTSDYIIEGIVENVESRWNEENTSIFTYSDIAIEEYVKGTPFTENELQIITPGGSVGGITEWMEDQPTFHEGKEVRVHLKETDGEFSIVCAQSGILEISNYTEPTCVDECSPGVKVCSGSGYKTCGNYDSDSCFEWSSVTDCPGNTTCENGDCIPVPPFNQSVVLFDVSEETGKPDQYYCSYDETRNRIAIIIKENGVYDSEDVGDKFTQYFSAVKEHLNINNVGVKKFSGSTIDEFDEFIENLVKNELVGYIILVGTDLPIAKPTYDPEFNTTYLSLDTGTINDIYSYVDRTKEVGVNQCVDVAISVVVSPHSDIVIPENYTDEKRREFVGSVFSNFVNYHKNPSQTYGRFNKTNFVILDDPPYSYSPDLDPYRTIYFYNLIYADHAESLKIVSNLRNKPLVFMYHVHGWASVLGFGLNNDTTITSVLDILDFYNESGQISLFVDSLGVCGSNILGILITAAGDPWPIFCCWPQTWLKTDIWAVTEVTGYPYHHSFQRWVFKEKVIGKALRKTYHTQNQIYGDILAKYP